MGIPMPLWGDNPTFRQTTHPARVSGERSRVRVRSAGSREAGPGDEAPVRAPAVLAGAPAGPPRLSPSVITPGGVEVGRVGRYGTRAFERWALTVSITTPDLLDRKPAAPTNSTRIGSRPTGRLDVWSVTLPPSYSAVPRTDRPSRKMTVPVGAPRAWPTDLTAAVSVTGCPMLAGLGCAVNTVFVRTGAAVGPTGRGAGVGLGVVGEVDLGLVGVGVGLVGVGVGLVGVGLVGVGLVGVGDDDETILSTPMLSVQGSVNQMLRWCAREIE